MALLHFPFLNKGKLTVKPGAVYSIATPHPPPPTSPVYIELAYLAEGRNRYRRTMLVNVQNDKIYIFGALCAVFSLLFK
jgi:hypothetical protein